MNSIIYSICELPSDEDKRKGFETGDCVTDGYSRDGVIDAATNYFYSSIYDEGERGFFQKDVIIHVCDEANQTDFYEEITLDIKVPG